MGEEQMITAIIQARMNSTRLPNKVLMDICGKPMIWHIWNRLMYADMLDKVVISTSVEESSIPIIEFAKEYNIEYFAGSEEDLLDRWYQTAKHFKASAIVRVTCDCPLVDPYLVDELVSFYLDEGPYDFVSNARPKATYPKGLDIEIFNVRTLGKVWKEIKDPLMREWGSANFFEHPDKYMTANLVYKENLSNMRWTVDYPEDMEFVREIYKRLYKEDDVFLMSDILEVLRKNPRLSEINKKYAGEDTYKEVMR
jgi:spore coat polysaccharide biosynthesis protein SpsF